MKGWKLNRWRNVKGRKLSSFGLLAKVGLLATVDFIWVIGNGKLIGDDECIIGDSECAYRRRLISFGLSMTASLSATVIYSGALVMKCFRHYCPLLAMNFGFVTKRA